MSSCKDKLMQVPVERYSGDIVVVSSDDTITDAFETLVSKKILSAPVWDPETKEFTGILDVMDIMALMCMIFNPEELPNLTSLSSIKSQEGRFAKEQLEEKFHMETDFVRGALITDMGGLSGVNPFVPVTEGASLWSVLKVMVTKKLHRVPVMDASGAKVLNYVTQSRLVQFLAEHEEAVPESLRKTPLSELGIKTDDVISCNETDRAIDVFSTMSKNGVSALPILDEEGCFTNVVSASDLKGIGEDCSSFYRLAQNIIDYISPLRQANLKSKYPAISCTLDHTLGQLIQKLNASRIHRVFVVDENKHVVGIASLGDVLRVIYEAILRISPDPPEVETL